MRIPHEGKQYFETIPWIIFGVLVFDLYLKYVIVGRNIKLLLKHYWLDISMIALIPLLLPLKFIKVTLKLFKAVKATKFGYKSGYKVNKFSTVIRKKRIIWHGGDILKASVQMAIFLPRLPI